MRLHPADAAVADQLGGQAEAAAISVRCWLPTWKILRVSRATRATILLSSMVSVIGFSQ